MDAQDLFERKAGGPVPEVDPADIKSAWQLYEDVAKRHPGKQVGIARAGVEAVCTPGANVSAVCYRRAMLQVLVSNLGEQLESWTRDGRLDAALFCAAAKTRMEWMSVGVEREGLPLDVEEFLRRVRGE